MPSRSDSAVRPVSLCEALEPRQLLTTYYVSPGGSDAAPGTSPATAWRTIDRVNQLNFAGGDRVLFEGGQTFALESVSGSNLLPNGGFESGLTHWTEIGPTDGGGASLETSVVHGGQRALRLGGSGELYRGQDVTDQITPGRAYTFSVFGRVSDTNPTRGRARAGIQFFNDGALVGNMSLGLRTPTFQRQARDFIAPGAFDQAVVYVERDDGSIVVWADDLALTAAPQPLMLSSEDSGTKSMPITLGSYGSGRATIHAGDHSAITGIDVQNVVIQDLNITGTWLGRAGTGPNTGSGIEFVSNLPDDGKLHGIYLRRLSVSGFKWTGIRFEGRVGKAGFSSVWMNQLNVHDNGQFGITLVRNTSAMANLTYAYDTVRLRDSFVYHNGGIASTGGVSGVGVHIGETDDAIVERVVAYGNGRFNSDPHGGPVGIMAIDSNNVLFQYNEAFWNQSATAKDGSGLDFDGGVTNSVMQYNYTHHNDGPGMHVAQPDDARDAWHNNVIRYNISENDARHGDYGAIHLFGGSAIRELDIHNNTVYLTPSNRAKNANDKIAAIRVRPVGRNVTVRNNIFITTGGLRVVRSDSATQTARFIGNDYWSSNAPFRILWGGQIFSSLSSWRGTGQETSHGAPTGLQAAPRLWAPGSAGTIANPGRLAQDLEAYHLRPNSPLVDAATGGLTLQDLDDPVTDFFGSTVPKGRGLDVGAHELR